jgi:hypothetical protein
VKGFISQIPRTVQDALLFTEKIGESYLWVDALCIVQDDHANTQVEIARMATIYDSAFLTLVAADATDGDCTLAVVLGGGGSGAYPVPEYTGIFVSKGTRRWGTGSTGPRTPRARGRFRSACCPGDACIS